MSELNDKERIDAVQNAFIEKLNQVLDFIPGYRGYRKGVENAVGMAQGEPNRYSVGEYIKDLGYSVVPFYGAYDNAISDRPQDWKMNALEAALIAYPMRGTRGRPITDPVRTAEFNKLYGEAIDNMAPSDYKQWAADMKNKYGQEKPWTIEDYRNNDEYIRDVPELRPYKNDIILDNTMGTAEPIDVKDYLKSQHRGSGFDLTAEEMFPGGQGSALESAYKHAETDPWTRAVAKHTDDGFTGGVVDYFEPRKYDINDVPLSNAPYSTTVGDLAEAKQLAKERAAKADMSKFVYGEDGKYSYYGPYDAQLRNIREENFRKDYADLHDEYYNILNDPNMDRQEKVTRLNGIVNQLSVLRSLIDIK